MICDPAVNCRSVLFGLCVGGTALSIPLPRLFAEKDRQGAARVLHFPPHTGKKPLTFLPVCGILFIQLAVHNRMGAL